MTTDTVPKGASRRVDVDGVPVTVTGIAKGAGMIHPDMATMLAFIATDAPIAAPLLARRSRARSPTSRSTARPSTATRRPTTASCSPPPARRRSPPIARAERSAPRRRCAPRSRQCAIELAQAIVRDGEGATKFIAIRVEGGTRRRRVPARRVRHRALAAGQDRVLRVRPQPRPHRLRDRQRRGAGHSIRRASRSGSTTCWSSTAAAARASYREEDGQRVMKQDEISDARRPRRAARRRAHGVDLRLLARLRVDQRRLPLLSTARRRRARGAASDARSRAPRACSTRVEALLPPPLADPGLDAASPRRAGASAAAAATCRRSRIRTRSDSTSSSRSTTQKQTIDAQHAPVRRRAAREQRAAHGLARHRQVVAGQGDAREVRAARACA